MLSIKYQKVTQTKLTHSTVTDGGDHKYDTPFTILPPTSTLVCTARDEMQNTHLNKHKVSKKLIE